MPKSTEYTSIQYTKYAEYTSIQGCGIAHGPKLALVQLGPFPYMLLSWYDHLHVKCFQQASVLEHLVPSCWYCVERLRKL